MSIKLNIPLDFAWSITENGEPRVEIVHRDGDSVVTDAGEFVFDADTLLGALDTDIGFKYLDPNTDITEWVKLVHFLRTTAGALEAKYKDSFS